MSGYLVVEFLEEERAVEVVPAKWVFQANSKCNWPCGLDRLKFSSLVSKCVDPLDYPKITWSVCSCKVLFGTDNFQRALKAADKATVQSDLESTDSEAILGKGRRLLRNQVKQKLREPSHEDSENNVSLGEDSAEIISASKPVKEKVTGGQEAGSIIEVCYPAPGNETESSEHGATIFSLNVPSVLTPDPNVGHQHCSQTSDVSTILEELRAFQKVVLDKLLRLTREIDHISRVVGHLGVSSVDGWTLDLPEDIVLPLKDGTQLALIHRWLEKATNQQKMISYLRGIGGSDVSDCIRRMLDRLFTTQLSRSINFSGANKKIAFKKHLLRSSVIGAIRVQPDKPTEKEIDDVCIRFFGGSGDRDGGRADRRKKKAEENLEKQASVE